MGLGLRNLRPLRPRYRAGDGDRRRRRGGDRDRDRDRSRGIARVPRDLELPRSPDRPDLAETGRSERGGIWLWLAGWKSGRTQARSDGVAAAARGVQMRWGEASLLAEYIEWQVVVINLQG